MSISGDTRAHIQEVHCAPATRADLERNKQVARQVIERIFIRQDDAAIDELVSDRFVPHTFGPMAPGREGLREGMRRAGAGVSDARFEIHDMIAEDDRVAVRLTTSARHTGRFMGIEPTGNRYTIDEIHIFRIRDGQVVEHWHEFDRAALSASSRATPRARSTGRTQPCTARSRRAPKTTSAAPETRLTQSSAVGRHPQPEPADDRGQHDPPQR